MAAVPRLPFLATAAACIVAQCSAVVVSGKADGYCCFCREDVKFKWVYWRCDRGCRTIYPSVVEENKEGFHEMKEKECSLRDLRTVVAMELKNPKGFENVDLQAALFRLSEDTKQRVSIEKLVEEAKKAEAKVPPGAETGPEVVQEEDSKVEETKAEYINAEEPKVEEPKKEEPKVEETKVEETKVEDTKVGEPKVEEPKTEVITETGSNPETVNTKNAIKTEANGKFNELTNTTMKFGKDATDQAVHIGNGVLNKTKDITGEVMKSTEDLTGKVGTKTNELANTALDAGKHLTNQAGGVCHRINDWFKRMFGPKGDGASKKESAKASYHRMKKWFKKMVRRMS